MNVLEQAIVARFNATSYGQHNTLYNYVNGQLYNERAKQTATLPYVVFHIIDVVPEWNFGSEFERVRVQFDLLSGDNSPVEVGNMFEALKALYDWQTLSITGYDHIGMRRESSRKTRDMTDDEWNYSVDYEVFFEKQN